MFSSRVLLSLPLWGLSLASFAIVTRDDRDDKLYRDLAKKYHCVCIVAGNGHGTLVGKNWVLTASHVAQVVSPLSRFVTFGEKNFRIKAVYLHPSWPGRLTRTSNDVALIELEKPVEGIKPVLVYEKSDEVGKDIVFVGSGFTGNGKTGPTTNDHVWRAAQNRIEKVGATFINFTFDAPPKGNDLEGISGPGDSGGPALLEQGGKTYIVGTSSANSSNGAECTYGSQEFYGRVSTASSWIHRTMETHEGAKPMLGEIKPLLGDWPTTDMTDAAKLFVEALSTKSMEKMDAFGEKYRTTKGPKADVEARRKRLGQMMEDYAPLKPVATMDTPDAFSVVCEFGRGKYLALTFFRSKEEPGRTSGVGSRVVPKPF